MVPPLLLSDREVRIRQPRPDDLEAVRRLFSQPEVARWWKDEGDGYLEGKVTGEGADDVVLVVEVDGSVCGIIQYYEELDPQYRHAGIDIALHPEVHGRGVGPRAITLLARHLFADLGHHRLVIDPAVENVRAIRAYRKVGFRPVGVMRRHWFDHVRQEWVDGLLMDLLAEELGEQPPADLAGQP